MLCACTFVNCCSSAIKLLVDKSLLHDDNKWWKCEDSPCFSFVAPCLGNLGLYFLYIKWSISLVHSFKPSYEMTLLCFSTSLHGHEFINPNALSQIQYDPNLWPTQKLVNWERDISLNHPSCYRRAFGELCSNSNCVHNSWVRSWLPSSCYNDQLTETEWNYLSSMSFIKDD